MFAVKLELTLKAFCFVLLFQGSEGLCETKNIAKYLFHL